MADAPDDGDLSGKVGRIEVDIGDDGGCRVSVFRWRSRPASFGPRRELLGAEDYDVADRDDLAGLVRGLMAEPPEGRAR